MKKLIAFLLPLTTQAMTVVWNDDPGAQGFKIYYREVKHEEECDDGLDHQFEKPIDVGEKPLFDLTTAFKQGRLYEIRASAYTIGFESALSKDRVCTRITGKPPKFEAPVKDSPADKKNKAEIESHGGSEGQGFGAMSLTVVQGDPPKPPDPPKIETPRHDAWKPESPSIPTLVKTAELNKDSKYDDEKEINVVGLRTGQWLVDDRPRGDDYPRVGLYRPSRTTGDRLQNLLGTEQHDTLKRDRRKAAIVHNLGKHINLYPESIGPGTRDRNPVLLRSDGLRVSERINRGIGSDDSSRVRADSSAEAQPAHWFKNPIAKFVALGFLSVMAVVWFFRLEEET